MRKRVSKYEDIAPLAGGAAHDFNNLPTSILGNTSLAMAQISETSPLFELLQEVMIAGNRAAVLTRQLLAYAGRGLAGGDRRVWNRDGDPEKVCICRRLR